MRAWRWMLLPAALLALIAATCSPNGGTVIPNFRCPVDGSTYRDDYGPRSDGSFHYGIDMLAPTGTPIWAVKSGSVHYALESAGGLVVYLSAVDGNVYYYAHMSAILGDGDRSVGQGEAIGQVGQTGNATGPHLHFEIRLGGVNGQRIDPYPTLRNAGC
ncbi:MAG TPA: M23 family metallopeptidase [Acidimicrobiia bacterium]|nr:M23 family metallopeptidase [Acidimicrobiia bacterium]